MLNQCIHGFAGEQCSSCRTCPHGQPAAACTRCRAELAIRRPARVVTDHPAQQHAGYEIYYESDVSGWRFRSPDAAPSALSYRSAFLARKAVDQLSEAPSPAAAKGKSSRRRKA
jgi:hypothetical protein